MTVKLKQELAIGNLVFHLLYGSEWRGVLLEFHHDEKGLSTPRKMGLVCVQPGTKYELFFKKTLTRYRISDNMGYVSLNWLRVLK